MPFNADSDDVRSAATSTAGCLGELENHLTALSNVQDELHTALVGAAGTATYNSFGDAHIKGKALASTLNDLIEQMRITGVRIDTSELEGQAKILAVAGADGSVDAGGWTDASKIKQF